MYLVDYHSEDEILTSPTAWPRVRCKSSKSLELVTRNTVDEAKVWNLDPGHNLCLRGMHLIKLHDASPADWIPRGRSPYSYYMVTPKSRTGKRCRVVSAFLTSL